jgi:hypothetical protein
VIGPRDPIDRCGTRPRPARQSGWPGPQGHGDSIGMADHRAARLSSFLLGRKARIQGPPIGPWPTAVREPHGPTARPSVHPRENLWSARCATGILTRRAETRNVALFMSSPAVAHKTSSAQPRKNQRPRPIIILDARTKLRGHMTSAHEPHAQQQLLVMGHNAPGVTVDKGP